MAHRCEHLCSASQLWLPHPPLGVGLRECFWGLNVWSRAVGSKPGKIWNVADHDSAPLLGSRPHETLRGGHCHDLQHSRACQTYFPQPWTRHVDPRSILAEQHTMPDEATKVGMRNTDAHICVPSLFSSQHVYIYPM